MALEMEQKLRASVSEHANLLEMILYAAVGVLLAVAAVLVLFQAGAALWNGIAGGKTASFALSALDQLLLVLMLVEILHTVRISIRTHKLTTVPFLIVGLIASIRRVLVITMQAAAAKLAESGRTGAADEASAFRDSMIELGVLALLISVFVWSIARLGNAGSDEDVSGE